ncbi:MAG TPA: hypothetical protein VK283_09715 [Acidimicrobiales bacterium]|nr:hypothetical protein [Acidimicrobiales bacterium]
MVDPVEAGRELGIPVSDEEPGRLERWAGHLATEQGNLVTEHDDLDCQLLAVTT